MRKKYKFLCVCAPKLSPASSYSLLFSVGLFPFDSSLLIRLVTLLRCVIYTHIWPSPLLSLVDEQRCSSMYKGGLMH